MSPLRSLEVFFSYLAGMSLLEFILIILAISLASTGSRLIKRRYLKRNNLTADSDIENRNSWIFCPKQYDLAEKNMMILIYVLTFASLFFLVIVSNPSSASAI